MWRVLVPAAFDPPIPFGPVPCVDVAVSLGVAVLCVSGLGASCLWCIFPRALRWISPQQAARAREKERSAAAGFRGIFNLAFIVLHNSIVTLLSALAAALQSPTMALHVFMLEVAYHIFDAAVMALANRLDHTTVFHHTLAPIAIFCSTRTQVDFRVLCHLMVLIDASGAAIAMGKLNMRFGGSRSHTYKVMAVLYVATRVVGAIVDTILIVASLLREKRLEGFAQHYIQVMLLLNVLNGYFAHVLVTRAFLAPKTAGPWDDDEALGDVKDIQV